MITGTVDGSEAVVELTISGAGEQSARLPFVIDTGFNGFVTLPQETVDELGLLINGSSHGYLGDGSITHFPICDAFVDWNGRSIPVRVEVAETEPLLGMRLLHGHRLQIDVLPGGTVRIVELPR